MARAGLAVRTEVVPAGQQVMGVWSSLLHPKAGDIPCGEGRTSPAVFSAR